MICADCLTALPSLAAGSVDVVVTSPPYNLGISYRGYDDRRAEDDYLSWLLRVAIEVRRVVKEDASFFLNISGSSSAPWLPFELIVRLRPLFVLQNHITWIKSIASRDSVGHFKPVGGTALSAPQSRTHLPSDTIGRCEARPDGDRSAVQGQIQHRPARSPPGPALSRQYMVHSLRHGAEQGGKVSSPEHVPRGIAAVVYPSAWPGIGTVVLDPFMGTGTTMVAAQLEGARQSASIWTHRMWRSAQAAASRGRPRAEPLVWRLN